MTSKVNKSLRIDFSRINVLDFLEELNLRNVEDRGLEVFYSCPFIGHNAQDEHPSASMRQGTTVAYCFGCGWRGNALSFLADLEGVSPLVAARWIRQRFGDDFQEPEGTFLEEIDTILAGSQKRENIKCDVLNDYEAIRRQVPWFECEKVWRFGTDDMVATVPIPFIYMFERGFKAKPLEEYEIGWDAISQRITIPYRNEKGELLGFKGRAYLKGQEPRYWVLGGPEYGFESFNVSQTLWGLYNTIQSATYSPNYAHVIVVEGELNALAMKSYGYDLAVGVSGKHLSEAQVNLIKKYFSSAVFIFDEVEDSLVAAEKLQPFMAVNVVLNHDKDPADMTEEEVKELIAKQMTPLELALSGMK